MDIQKKIILEIVFNGRDNRLEALLVSVDNDDIIDIPTVIFAAELVFHKMVEIVQVNVAEQLGGKIADGKPLAFPGKEEAFAPGQTQPIFFFSLQNASSGRIVEHHLADKT